MYKPLLDNVNTHRRRNILIGVAAVAVISAAIIVPIVLATAAQHEALMPTTEPVPFTTPLGPPTWPFTTGVPAPTATVVTSLPFPTEPATTATIQPTTAVAPLVLNSQSPIATGCNMASYLCRVTSVGLFAAATPGSMLNFSASVLEPESGRIMSLLTPNGLMANFTVSGQALSYAGNSTLAFLNHGILTLSRNQSSSLATIALQFVFCNIAECLRSAVDYEFYSPAFVS